MSDTGAFCGDPGAGFSRFYRELHSADEVKRENGPYLWQKRLAKQLSLGGAPALPRLLQAPTGAGKTTLIEAFLFALAWQRHHCEKRTFPRRLFWVVDRRSVVDQVHRHAERVADQINTSAAATVREVREALATVVQCQCWRAGSGLRPTAVAPDSAAIISSTVDQVGSRLLFRGYGTSRAARPIEAALTGTDSLIVIDEAHISQPFNETLQAVISAQDSAENHPGQSVRAMRMSATLFSDDADGFRLTARELAEPAMARRVEAEKMVRLAPPAKTRVAGLTKAANELACGPGLIGVIANTVEEARCVHAELSAEHGKDNAWLLIGPNRQIYRDALIDAIPGRAERAAGTGPKLIVATQTIEVGVDLDFDALATACAPLDALIQRLGRLDRAGQLGKTEAIVVHSREACLVYGEMTANTWDLLSERAEEGVVRMGSARIEELLADLSPQQLTEVTTPQPRAPLLTPWQIEALSQTSEDPVPTPEIALFLHGDETLPSADVNVAWRADLRTTRIGRPAPKDDWEERVRARPPHPDESISLPIGRIRAWLSHKEVDRDPLADVESAVPSAVDGVATERESTMPFVLVTPNRRASRVEARWSVNIAEIEPGATVVVPCSYGCCDDFGWIPGASIGRDHNRPEDLGDLDAANPRLLLDLASASIPPSRSKTARTLVDEVRSKLEVLPDEIGEIDLYSHLREPIVEWLRSHPPDVERPTVGARGGERRRRQILLDRIEGSATGAVRTVGAEGREYGSAGAKSAIVLVPDLDEATGGRAHRPVSLADHSNRVARHARRLASAACSDDGIVRAVEIAARYHDHGKLDQRFQRWMYLGEDPDPLRPLAKSGIDPGSRRSRSARIAAGWPRDKRHEASSALLLARSALAADSSVDIDLAVYLVAVHHGRNRPFLPEEGPDLDRLEIATEIEDDRVTVRSSESLDWASHASLFARLNRRYSPWGLALIEATLVQADWLASREER